MCDDFRSLLYFVKMAVAFAHLHQPQRENRQFAQRVRLEDVSDDGLLNYHVPRDIIEDIITGFAASEYGNLTEGGHATPSDTQVGKISTTLEIYSSKCSM